MLLEAIRENKNKYFGTFTLEKILELAINEFYAAVGSFIIVIERSASRKTDRWCSIPGYGQKK